MAEELSIPKSSKSSEDEKSKSYSKSIDKYPDMSSSNRTWMYLPTKRPLHTLEDLEIDLEQNPDDEQMIYWKCKTLLALRRFSDAARFLDESILRLHHLWKNNEFETLIKDMNRLQLEYEYGQYDLPSMIEESEKSKFLDNHADYIDWNKFEIRKIDGKGRGLVAKRKIEAGELLMACKALALFESGTRDTMVAKIREILLHRRDLAEAFYRLYAGPRLGYLENGMNGGESGSIDDRIKSIITYNAFDAVQVLGSRFGDDGMWLVPSYINHTCVDRNCDRYFVGDYMFVRSTKLIEKGDEILFPYISPLLSAEYRQRTLRDKYGIDCQCRLCVLEHQESIEIKKRFDEVDDKLYYISENAIQYSVRRLKRYIDQLLQLRPQRDLNYLAIQVEQRLSDTVVDDDESLQLILECVEWFKSVGDFTSAFNYFITMRNNFVDEKFAREECKMEIREIAKFFYGDERVADLVFASDRL